MGDLKCVDGLAPSASVLYLLGVLAGTEVESFESHLPRCPYCQSQCDDLGPLVEVMALMPAEELKALLDGDDASVQDQP